MARIYQKDRKAEHAKFIRSKEWAVMRTDLLMIRGKFCELCGKSRSLQIHHITYDRFGGDEEPEDLVILCNDCHMNEHGLVNKNGKVKKKKVRKRKKPKVKKKFERKIRVCMNNATETETVEDFLHRGGEIKVLMSKNV